jgi:hypothetical protein
MVCFASIVYSPSHAFNIVNSISKACSALILYPIRRGEKRKKRKGEEKRGEKSKRKERRKGREEIGPGADREK